MSDLICVLYACTCGHPESDHEDEHGGHCMEIFEINDLEAVLCECSGFVRATSRGSEAAP